MKHFAQAVKIQAVADVRSQILGISALNILIVPTIWVILGRWMSGTVEGFGVTAGHFLIAGSLVGFSAMIAYQIAAETFNEYRAGTLLRVRTLPQGVKIWTTAKLLTAAIVTLVTQLLIFVATILFIPGFELTWAKVGLLIPCLLLTLLASAPLGFIMGAFTRSTVASLIGMIAFMGLMIASGIFFPIDILPGWVQGISKCLPIYHGGVLSRWVFIETPEPVLISTIVLAVWFIVGIVVARKVITMSFSKVSLGEIARAQQDLKSALGM
ncbi:ABC transporter permease [Trueperella pyogenes]|uniref:ABC transporter permease n=1 Tax=Trueperella pyogenes TaxID=1661 RepID=UPI00345DAB1A